MADHGPKTPHEHLALRGSTLAKQSRPRVQAPTRLESTIIDLYVRGLRRRKIARLLVEHLPPAVNGEGMNRRLQLASRRLRNLEGRKWFRDLLWERAMIAADMRTPNIMAGGVRKAGGGRGDAAKPCPGINGRVTEHA